jgi:hypothetical protein
MVTPTPRVPELRPRLLGGRALDAVRTLRVTVTPDGAVVARSSTGTTTLAAPGEVRRLLHVAYGEQQIVPGEGYTGPVIVLVGAEGRPLTAFRVLDWIPPSHPLPREELEVAGFRALAAALGLPLEPAEEGDLPSAREVGRLLFRPVPPRPWPGRSATPLCVLALVLFFIALTQAEEAAGAVFCATTLALMAPVIICGSRARAVARRAIATVGRVPGPVIRPRPGRPVARGLLEATLRREGDDVVLTDRGHEVWLPGPAGGGVSQVIIEPELVRLADAHGRDYARMETALWAPTPADVEQLQHAVTELGLEASTRSLPSSAYPVFAILASAPMGITTDLSDAERGDATFGTTWLSGLAVFLTFFVAVISTTWSPVSWALVVVSGGLVWLRAADTVRQWLADRRAVRRVRPAAVEALR